MIHNKDKQVFAIECKFTEAYGWRSHGLLDPEYLTYSSLWDWDGIPELRKLAVKLSAQDDTYRHLHRAQLLKHILGLRRNQGSDGFRLLYLWYDALGSEGARHREEVEEFSEIAKSDGIWFRSATYQEVIAHLAEKHRSEHPQYIDYIADRNL